MPLGLGLRNSIRTSIRELDGRTSICQSIRMEVHAPDQRTRGKHFVLRLNDHERAALDRVSHRLHLNASETMRYLIRRADDEASGDDGGGRRASGKKLAARR